MPRYSPPESIQPLLENHPSIYRFRRALRRADQIVFDDILERAASANPDGPSSFALVELLLLAMLMAEHKQLSHLTGLFKRLPAGGLTPAEELPAGCEKLEAA
jgi:hypothetical protein